jgi:hypothetical protein
MEKVIYEYVRNKENAPVGLVLATVVNGKVAVGWSKACKRDKFDRELGIKIATGRAAFGSDIPLPTGYEDRLRRLIVRAKKYFKQAN